MSKIKPIKDFIQGDSFTIKVEYNPVVNITNDVFTLILTKNENSVPVLKVTHTATGADASNGITHIPVSSSQTSNIQAGDYYVSLTKTKGTEVTTLFRTNVNKVDKVTCHSNLDISE
jgi:hypothetical protein